MIIMSTDAENMEKLTFHEDQDGFFIPFFEDMLFTGTIIDSNGELTYDNGELVDILEYSTRTLH